jgi:hypothetical protein
MCDRWLSTVRIERYDEVRGGVISTLDVAGAATWGRP